MNSMLFKVVTTSVIVGMFAAGIQAAAAANLTYTGNEETGFGEGFSMSITQEAPAPVVKPIVKKVTTKTTVKTPAKKVVKPVAKAAAKTTQIAKSL